MSTLSRTPARKSFKGLTFRQRTYVVAVILLIPALALRVFTAFYPFVQTAYLSLHRFNPAFDGATGPVFVGLGNFQRIANDPVVRASIGFTLTFVVVATFLQITLGLAVAHLLDAPFRFRGLSRTLVLVPWAIPMVIVALGFRWMFDDQFGMIPDLLRHVGLEMKWLINPTNAKIAVISVAVWKSTPFVALVLLAGLQGISQDLYEAARVDGANWFTSLRYITIPMIMPIIITTSMFMVVWQLAVFDLPFLMTGGGPGFSTTVIAQKIYLESNSLNYGYAASIGMVLVAIVAIVGAIGLYLFRRFDVSE